LADIAAAQKGFSHAGFLGSFLGHLNRAAPSRTQNRWNEQLKAIQEYKVDGEAIFPDSALNSYREFLY
jgi:hypothetical protein